MTLHGVDKNKGGRGGEGERRGEEGRGGEGRGENKKNNYLQYFHSKPFKRAELIPVGTTQSDGWTCELEVQP